MVNEAGPGASAEGLIAGEDGLVRCRWGAEPELYRRYHDHEWGRPVTDDVHLFEKLCLEGFQSGLSWLTILRKRENFRAAFDGFDFERVARYDEADVKRLLVDAGIVRHRGKIEAAIGNAARAIELRDEFGSLAAFFWSFEPSAGERPERMDWAWAQANTTVPRSHALSKALKARGWRFVGPTTMYALMQAMGIVNDRLEGCCAREGVEAARRALVRPTAAPPRSPSKDG